VAQGGEQQSGTRVTGEEHGGKGGQGEERSQLVNQLVSQSVSQSVS
jgi:hypothetical protein